MLRCQTNGENDTLEIFHHIVIGESKHAITARGEPFIAPRIVAKAGFEIVTLTIDLDDQLAGMRNEVGDVVAHGSLASKGKTRETIGLEVTPQQRLRASHLAP